MLSQKLLNKVSDLPLAFGGGAISGEGGGYGFGNISDGESTRLLEYAYEKGIKIFDTAPIYGFGDSERRLAPFIKERREKLFVISKSGVTWDDHKRVNMTNDPQVTQKMLEQSLRDLKSDYIDLFMIHWPDNQVDIRRPMEILSRAKHEGKIKHIGLCNTYHEDLINAMEIDRVEVVQSEFNLFNHWAENLFPLLDEHNISFMSWGTYDKGILTYRVTADRKFDESDCRNWAPWWKKSNKNEKMAFMKKIEPLLKRESLSGSDLAVAYNLSHPQLTTMICGMRNTDQIDSTVASLKRSHEVNSDLLAEISELLKKEHLE